MPLVIMGLTDIEDRKPMSTSTSVTAKTTSIPPKHSFVITPTTWSIDTTSGTD